MCVQLTSPPPLPPPVNPLQQVLTRFPDDGKCQKAVVDFLANVVRPDAPSWGAARAACEEVGLVPLLRHVEESSGLQWARTIREWLEE